MDRLIYIAMTGAQQLLQQQAVTAHNLANAATTGYKAETSAFRVAPVQGPGLPTRAYALDSTPGADMSAGTLQETGRDLDIAVDGDGFFAVEGRDGTESYTRNGSFDISADGDLITRAGLPVLGEGGPINVPQDAKVAIGRDGTVSATIAGQSAANVTVIGKLKLVKPNAGDLVKAGDGLFRTRNGAPLEADASVTVQNGRLESSNVNPVSAMVDQNEQRATQLLAAGGS
jgi:flagellar basal-body rod protein FlgF